MAVYWIQSKQKLNQYSDRSFGCLLKVSPAPDIDGLEEGWGKQEFFTTAVNKPWYYSLSRTALTQRQLSESNNCKNLFIIHLTCDTQRNYFPQFQQILVTAFFLGFLVVFLTDSVEKPLNINYTAFEIQRCNIGTATGEGLNPNFLKTNVLRASARRIQLD